MFGAMQVAKRIPFEDQPEYIVYARAAYVAAQLFCLLINYYCTFRVSLPLKKGREESLMDVDIVQFLL